MILSATNVWSMTDISSSLGSGPEETAVNTYAIEVIPSDVEGDGYSFVPRSVSENQRLIQWIVAKSEAIADLSEWH